MAPLLRHGGVARIVPMRGAEPSSGVEVYFAVHFDHRVANRAADLEDPVTAQGGEPLPRLVPTQRHSISEVALPDMNSMVN